jgi:serine/threonine protein kinase
VADQIQKLGKYEIVEVLGRGAMGVVYKGYDRMLERHVALKTIRRDAIDPERSEEYAARFKTEALAGARMLHPGIVGVYEYGEDQGVGYIAMEFVQGRGLRDYFAKHERFGLRDTMSIMEQLLDALGYAHDRGVVHRDIKPANLIITAEARLKVADFGIARLDNSSLTQVGSIMGTPSYMSPEQFAGLAVDHRTDLFSAGVVFYELLTGTKPFQGATETISYKVCHEEHRDPSEIDPEAIPPAFDEVAAKALAKKREERFQSAREFAKVLRAAHDRSRNRVPDIEATVLDDPPDRASTPDRPETTTYPPSQWPVEELRAVEALLTPYMGPVAKVLVKKAARESSEGFQLVALLAQGIASAEDRKTFHAAALRRVNEITGPQKTSSTVLRGTGATGAPAPADRLAPEEIERAARMLLPYVGPIANIIAKRAAAQAADRRAFYQRLGESITDAGARASFLEECGAG